VNDPIAIPNQPAYDPHRDVLNRLLDSYPEIRGVVLARTDGFEVASATRDSLSVSRVSAIASSLVALGQAALRELGLGAGGSVLVDGSNGKLLLIEFKQQNCELVLALLGDKDLVTGTLLWAARDCVKSLETLTV